MTREEEIQRSAGCYGDGNNGPHNYGRHGGHRTCAWCGHEDTDYIEEKFTRHDRSLLTSGNAPDRYLTERKDLMGDPAYRRPTVVRDGLPVTEPVRPEEWHDLCVWDAPSHEVIERPYDPVCDSELLAKQTGSTPEACGYSAYAEQKRRSALREMRRADGQRERAQEARWEDRYSQLYGITLRTLVR